MKGQATFSSGAVELIRDQTLVLALQPKDNPAHLDFDRYTLPLIAHDYPALTAAMWNAAYRAFGVNAGNCMVVGQPRNAAKILDAFRRDARYLGGGVGVGFKTEVFGLLDELDDIARAVGSVNFVMKTAAGKLRGYNTDGIGYAESLAQLLALRGANLTGKHIVLLGAGGTGLAIAHALADRGARLIVVNRTLSKASALADRVNKALGRNAIRCEPETQLPGCLEKADVVINVTTIGAAGEFESYVPLAPVRLPPTPQNLRQNHDEATCRLSLLSRQAIVSDVVLARGGTPLLRAAKTSGIATLDGVSMVIRQGVESFWILHRAELSTHSIQQGEVAAIMEAHARNLK